MQTTQTHTDRTRNGQENMDPMDLKQARGFYTIATTVFAPIYPIIAGQILDYTGMRAGTALDIGAGPALLSVALARQSDLKVIALDRSPAMLMVAAEHIRAEGLVRRILPAYGDVHEIPCEDSTVHLITSRGSWFFWDDLCTAFREIHRVLATGGYAYIGGGFGTAVLKEEINSAMRAKNPEWDTQVRSRFQRNNPVRIRQDLESAGIRSYQLIEDDSGFWAVFRKEE